MAFQIEAPTIPLSEIIWDEIGENDPKNRLLAHIRIGTLDLHLEAREIDGSSEEQTTIEYPEDCATLQHLADSAFETLEIEDRRYLVFAFPYGD